MKSFHAEVDVCVYEQKEYHNDYEHSKWKYTPVADSADMQHHVQNKKIASMVPLVTHLCPVFSVVSSPSQRDCHLEKIDFYTDQFISDLPKVIATVSLSVVILSWPKAMSLSW